MKSFDPGRTSARLVVDQLVAVLSEPCLMSLIDEPINAAAQAFSLKSETPDSCERVHDTVALFVRHLREHAGVPPGCASSAEATDESAMLLERAYGGRGSASYYAALRDALDDDVGMQEVLARVTEFIKLQRRDAHKRAVIARCVSPLNWRGKCAVTAELLERCRPALRKAPRSLEYQPEELLDCIPDLLDLVLTTEQTKMQLLSGPFTSLG